MDNFNGGPHGFGPGPMSGGMPLDMESRFMYNSVGGSSSSATDYRIKIDITQAREIPKYRFIARFVTRLKLLNDKQKIRNVNKYMRKSQIQLKILEDMNKQSLRYGDRVIKRSKISSDDILNELDEENTEIDFKPRFGISKWFTEVRKAFSDLSERVYIFRQKNKAVRKFHKKSRRDAQIRLLTDDVKHKNDILDGHLFHNYNINSIFLGRMHAVTGFYGMMPDKTDIDTIKKSSQTNSANQNKQTQQNTNQQTQQNMQTQQNTNQQTQQNTPQQPQPTTRQNFQLPSYDFPETIDLDEWMRADESNKYSLSESDISFDVEYENHKHR